MQMHRLRRRYTRFRRRLLAAGHRVRKWWAQETRISKFQRGRAFWGFFFVLPWIAGFLIFKLIPILVAFVLSFTNYTIRYNSITSFIGLGNYARLVSDFDAWASLFANLGAVLIIVPVQIMFAFFFATLSANKRLIGKSFYRTFFFLPAIIPSAALIQIMAGFFEPGSGWWNMLIASPLGIPQVPGLGSITGQSYLFALSVLWAVGPGYLILLAAMQSIPQDLYEAAKIDGAGPVNRLLHVTLPMISPAVFFSLVVNLIAVFGGIGVLDMGNPFFGSPSPVDNFLYYLIFTRQELGYAVSAAWVFFLLVMAATILLFRTAPRWVFYTDREGAI